jgi:serine/threonine protein kinase
MNAITQALPQVADHVLIRQIGKGSYGVVWLAKSIIGGFHAVKVIERQKLPDERSYQREFDGICNFEPISRCHPGLVTILHVGQHKQAGNFYYVMELADDARTGRTITPDTYLSRTLKEEMANHPRLPLDTKLQIALSLTSALGYIHEQGLIHRDIKPSNIIFVNDEPKIADIGLITQAGEDVSDRGTLYYMPPEGPGKLTADIFSLGKVFYELFMGMHPKDFPELPHAAEEFTSVPELLRINNLILKACQHDPRQRFQTTKELYKALQAVAGMVHDKQTGTGMTETTGSQSSKPASEPRSKSAIASVGHTASAPEGRLGANGEPPKAQWTRRDVLVGLGGAVTGGAVLFGLRKPDRSGQPGTEPTNSPLKTDASPANSVTGPNLGAPPREPIVVLMDTTAKDGVYERDTRDSGGSNTIDIKNVLQENDFLPPRNLHSQAIDWKWSNEDFVCSLRPDLVIIHRSSFYHPVNALFGFPKDHPYTDSLEEEKWQRFYSICENKLLLFMAYVATRERRTQFLVYSRGTDPKWTDDHWRTEEWAKPNEARFPELKDRIKTMVVAGGYEKGTFRDIETKTRLRKIVKDIFGDRVGVP